LKKKLPIPEPQGNTPMERLDWAFRTVLKVPKAALLKDEERTRRTGQTKAKPAKL
jgi:hypothetical protein